MFLSFSCLCLALKPPKQQFVNCAFFEILFPCLVLPASASWRETGQDSRLQILLWMHTSKINWPIDISKYIIYSIQMPLTIDFSFLLVDSRGIYMSSINTTYIHMGKEVFFLFNPIIIFSRYILSNQINRINTFYQEVPQCWLCSTYWCPHVYMCNNHTIFISTDRIE